MGSPELVTIAVVPRERFSYARRSLESVVRETTLPHQCVYVDAGSPRRVRQEIAAICAREGIERIETDRYLSPNQARNLALARVRTRYVVFVDNDAIVTPGWLEALVACAEETGAWIVGPLYCIGPLEEGRIHMAGGATSIRTKDGKRRLREKHGHQNVLLAQCPAELRRGECDFAEFHCMLVRMEAFEKLGPLDEELLCSREHLDLSLAVRAAGGRIYFEPSCLVTYIPPPPFEIADIPFYLLRWSDQWGETTLRHFNRKWGFQDHPGRLTRKWFRPHRRVVFEPLRRRSARLLGARLGGGLADGLTRAVEAVVIALALRKTRRAVSTRP